MEDSTIEGIAMPVRQGHDRLALYNAAVNRRVIAVPLILASFLILSSVAHAAPADPNNREIGGGDIAETVKALKEIKVVEGVDTTVPPRARPLLTTLKHQLRDLIYGALDTNLHGSNKLEDVGKALSTELERQGIVAERPDIVVVGGGFPNRHQTYWEIQQIAIIQVPGHPDMIGATTTIRIPCGNDSSLYLFKRSGQEWTLVLAQEANDYENIGDAQGSFKYAVSPSSDNGQFFVVTKDVNPWCSSNWHAIRYQVLRVGQSAYQPKVLLKRAETVYLGNERDGLIAIRPDGFSIEFDAGQRLDTGVIIRRHVVAYQVKDDQVRRVPPFAFEPEGFLDEWVDLPWKEASQWIDASASAELRKWHERLQTERSDTQVRVFPNFVFDPPACKVTRGQWQVGVELIPGIDKGSLPKGTPKEAYFTIIQKDAGYFLKDVSPRGARKCTE